MNAKDYLQQIRKINRLIENKTIDANFYRALAEGCAVPGVGSDKVQSSPSPDKMENAIIKCIALQDEIYDKIVELVSAKSHITETLERLPSKEYDVLHKMYVQDIPISVIAEEEEKSVSAICKLHGRGLQHVQRMLDEKGENRRNERG